MKYNIIDVILTIIPLVYRNKGINVLDEKWDNLIILDACKYETFKEVLKNSKLKGNLEYRISKGSNTPQWLINNFTLIYDDILYITANPQVDIYSKENFPKLVSVWKTGWNKPFKNKECVSTVLPEITCNYAIKSIKNIKHNRTIIHFIQPHSPYPNDTGEVEIKDKSKKNMKYKLDENLYAPRWPYISIKPLKVNKLQEGYKQNLELVIPYIEKLVKQLKGKTIISADHGEAFGEKLIPPIPFKLYGHQGNVRIPILTKVPWFIVK